MIVPAWHIDTDSLSIGADVRRDLDTPIHQAKFMTVLYRPIFPGLLLGSPGNRDESGFVIFYRHNCATRQSQKSRFLKRVYEFPSWYLEILASLSLYLHSIRKNCDGSGPVIWTDLRFDALDGFGPLGRRLAWKVERDLMSFGETEIRDAFHSRKGDVRRDQI